MSALPPKADIGTQPRDVRFVPQADIPVEFHAGYARADGVSFVNCGSIDSSNKITDFRSRVPHTLARGTFGTELPRGGVSLRRGPDGLRRGVDRRFALTRRGSPNFSCRGITGPSG